MSSFRVKLEGGQKAERTLRAARSSGTTALRQFVEGETLRTHETAVRGIQRGPASGVLYQKYNPRRLHQASAPGEYPMSDLGGLVRSVEFELPKTSRKPTGFVGTNLRYGAFLELKLPSLGGRPWLSRATREAAVGRLKRLVRIMKKHGLG